jgi:hypothetical protein
VRSTSSSRFYPASSLIHIGSSADSLAFRGTSLGQRLLNQLLPDRYFIVGDAAYTLSNNLLTPVPGVASNMGVWADSHNFHLSQLRITIERSFGIVVRRWGILWRPLECRFDRMAHVAICCLRLHNLCVDDNDTDFGIAELDVADGLGRRDRPVFDRDGVPVNILTGDPSRPPPNHLPTGLPADHNRRARIAELERMSIIRP